jgi:replicative DNA helicase
LVKKHRNGPTGSIELFFDRDKQRFRSLAKKQPTPFDN